MTEDQDPEEPETETEPEPESGPEEVAATPEDIVALAQVELQWAEFFRVMISERDPFGSAEDVLGRPGTKRVREAEADAITACYRAVERFAARFVPS